MLSKIFNRSGDLASIPGGGIGMSKKHFMSTYSTCKYAFMLIWSHSYMHSYCLFLLRCYHADVLTCLYCMYTRRQKTWALGNKIFNKETLKGTKPFYATYINSYTSNRWSTLLSGCKQQASWAWRPQQFLHYCFSALPVCSKTNPVKSDPELRAFRLEWSFFVHNIHLLGGTQGVHAQGS